MRACWHHLRSADRTWVAEAPWRKPRRARLAGEKVAPSRFRCGQAIAVNRGKRDIQGSRDIQGLQLVIIIIEPVTFI